MIWELMLAKMAILLPMMGKLIYLRINRCFNCLVERGYECTGGFSGVGGVGRFDTCSEICGDSFRMSTRF